MHRLGAPVADAAAPPLAGRAAVLPLGNDLRAELTALGVDYLTHRLSDLPVSNLRTVINQPAASGIGQAYYTDILRPAWALLAEQLARLMNQGHLRQADPWTAALHWRALNECDVLERRLLGVILGPDEAELRALANAATEAFLQIYGLPPETSAV